MRFHRHWGSNYLTVVFVSGLILEGVSQTDNDCTSVTTRSDFKPFENSCFWVSPDNDKRTWNGAQEICQTFGDGNLATVTKLSTVEFLKTNWSIQTNGYWIGLYLNATEANDPGLEGRRQANWKWVDGTTTYSHQSDVGWLGAEPEQQEKFVRLQYFKWRGAPKEAITLRFICETKLPDMPTQSPQQTKTTTPSSPEAPDIFAESGTQTPNLETKECGESGWLYVKTTDLCYYVQKTQALTWNEAETRCRNINGHLATPSTSDRHQAVMSILNQAGLHDSDVWIGLRHQNGAPSSDPKQGWEWVDNSQYYFQAWKQDEPSEGEMYVRMKRGTWWGIGAIGISASYNDFICQKASSVGLEPVKPVNPQSAEDPAKDPAVQTNDPNDVTRAPPASKNVLGPVLGAVGGIILVMLILTGTVIYIKRYREKINCLKKTSLSETQDEHYCDIKDEDLDRRDQSSPHVYYNEIQKLGNRPSQSDSAKEISTPEYYNEIDNYEHPVNRSINMGAPLSPAYVTLQKNRMGN